MVVTQAAPWRRLKSLVLDSVSSPITKRVYNLELDEILRLVRARAPARLHQGDSERMARRSGIPRAAIFRAQRTLEPHIGSFGFRLCGVRSSGFCIRSLAPTVPFSHDPTSLLACTMAARNATRIEFETYGFHGCVFPTRAATGHQDLLLRRGRIRYIGQSNNQEMRQCDHRSTSVQ